MLAKTDVSIARSRIRISTLSTICYFLAADLAAKQSALAASEKAKVDEQVNCGTTLAMRYVSG